MVDLIESITQAELRLWQLIAPYIGIVLAIIGAQATIRWTMNVACGIAFRLRGFKVNHLVRVDGELARITRIGLSSTTFRIVCEGERWEEYPEVLNSRLETLAIRRLVERADKLYPVEKEGG